MIALHAFVLFLVSQSAVSTDVGGVLLFDTTWTSASSPYNVKADVQIARDVTLIIEAGTTIVFDGGDFEILVKGYLLVLGTAQQQVNFQTRSNDISKWMITFKSTNLSRSSIEHAVLTGPKPAVQLTDVAPDLPQNTGALVLRSVTVKNNSTINTNGVGTNSSLTLQQSTITDSSIMTGDILSAPILLDNCRIHHSVFHIRNDGVSVMRSVVRQSSIRLDGLGSESMVRLAVSSSSLTNINIVHQVADAWTYATLEIQYSTIRNLIISDLYSSRGFHVIIKQSNLFKSEIRFATDTYFGVGSLKIERSKLKRVSISADVTPVTIKSSSISLFKPPAVFGPGSAIDCCTIRRAAKTNPNATGIVASSFTMSKSSLSGFGVGLRLAPPYINMSLLTSNNIYGNSYFNVENAAEYDIDAQSNWWGTADLNSIEAKLRDYWDDINLGEIHVTNYTSTVINQTC